MLIEECHINGKAVFVFEAHNLAPLAWDKIKRSCAAPPALLTLDHHTDTRTAFTKHAFWTLRDKLQREPTSDEREAEIGRLCADATDEEELYNAALKLKNDEHIDFAVRIGQISHAYVIAHQTNPARTMRSTEWQEWFEAFYAFENLGRRHLIEREPDAHYVMPANRLIELSNDHLSELAEGKEKGRIDLSLEDVNLRTRMDEIMRINDSVFPGTGYDFKENFILDIDLDYFNTRASINPMQCTVFYELIRLSKGITIAKESQYVSSCKLVNEDVSPQYLLGRMKEHIAQAMQET